MLATSDKMKVQKFYKLILILVVLTIACDNPKIIPKLTDKEIEDKSLAITNILDESNIDIFRKWNFRLRGGAEIWTNNINDSTSYRYLFSKSTDTIAIVAFKNSINSNNFPLSIKLDTSKYWQFVFKKSLDQKIKIFGYDDNGQEDIIQSNLAESELFENKSPFAIIDSLSELKDKLGVYGITYYERLGDFIQFYLSRNDALTFISDYSTFNPMYKEVWIDIFSKGKEIKPKWNLRHLDRPIDNG